MTTKPQDFILAAANIFASTMDFLEDIEKGETPLTAVKKAYKKGKKRAKALKRGAEDVGELLTRKRPPVMCPCGSEMPQEKCHGLREERIGVVEHPQPQPRVRKPFFEVCSCGCGLPKGQCQGRSAGGGKR